MSHRLKVRAGKWYSAVRPILRNEWNTAVSKGRFLSSLLSRGLSLGHRRLGPKWWFRTPENYQQRVLRRGLWFITCRHWFSCGCNSENKVSVTGSCSAQEACRPPVVWPWWAPFQVFTVYMLGGCNSGQVISPFCTRAGKQDSQLRSGACLNNL